MHAIERELIKVTGYKAARPFSDREDYLKSLLNAVMKLSDDDFDDLTNGAASWTNAAVDAHNSKNGTIPDFDEVAEGDETEDTGEDDDLGDETESEDKDKADDSNDVDPDEDDEDVDDAEGGDAEEAELADETADEDEPAPKSAKKKAATKAKPVKATKPEKEPKKAVTVKAAPKKAKPSEDDEEDVVVDKWGCMEGSKNARALAMFEKGATTKEVKEAIGGTYYNILGKMEKNGHTITKEGAIIKITHSQDKGKKAKK